MRIYALLVVLFMLLIHQADAQEQLGLRTDNYSGVNSLLLNPANNLTSKFTWDINLVAIGQFAENNYAFIRNTSLIDILKNTDNIHPRTDFENESQIESNMLILDYFDNNSNKYLSSITTVTGPSFMVNLDGNHSFGLFTNFRTVVSGQKLPAALGYYNFDRTPFGEFIEIPAFDVAGMAWSEIGLNYAYGRPTAFGRLGLGISLKILNGYEAFYLSNKSTISVAQMINDTISFNEAVVEFGLTTSNADGQNVGLEKNGRGLAIDIGFTYTIDGEGEDYLWKFGASLLDIGRIKFNSNAEAHRLDIETMITIDGGQYHGFDEIGDYISLISDQILNDPTASLQGRAFNIWLPAALSLQADYAIAPNFYANALLVQRLPMQLFGNMIARNNLLAVSPRFEHRWFGATLPLVLYNWRDFRIGTSVRLGFLTIGTDNLGSIFNRSTFTGTDFYVGLKINPFKLFGDGGGIPGWSPSGGKKVKCYKF